MALDNLYNRFDAEKNYEKHLFRAGYGLQSAELNEIQDASIARIKSIGDALLKDGDIIKDCQCAVDSETGVTTLGSGAIYIRGAVRGLPPATLTIPITGTVSVGIRLVEAEITELEDPALRDPALGTRNYQEPGAGRLQVEPSWGFQGDGETGEFFPVYQVINGALVPKEAPPNLDAVSTAIAVYDRDNSGGNYVVSGYQVTAGSNAGDNVQSITIKSGRARVSGYPIEHRADTRINRDVSPDLRRISAEPHLATGVASQTITLDRAPVASVVEVQVTREKTVTLTRGMVAGGSDTLPDASVLELVEVKQGATTYVVGTNVRLTAGKVDWSLTGAEPAGGSTYTVKYRYIATVIPAAGEYTETTITVASAVSGTLILVTYDAKLPRIDRLVLTKDGLFDWVNGIADDYNPTPPNVPANSLSIALVYQNWLSTQLPTVMMDAVRTVSMGEIQAINGRLDLLSDLMARQQLASDTSFREASLKKGLLVDPFLDNATRDLGVTQTAAVANGVLSLPIDTTATSLSGSNLAPMVLTTTSYVTALAQEARSGGMKVNPYSAAAIVPAQVTLNPAKDYWTETKVVNTSSTNYQNYTTYSSQSVRIGVNYYWGWGSYNAYAGSSTSTSSSTYTSSSTSSSTKQIGYVENLRQISVGFKISGFGPGETLQSITFDGIQVTPSA